MPQGLPRAIMSILLFHVGIKDRISKAELISQLAASGWATGKYSNIERKVRVAISQLRKAGNLIVSNSSGRGLYVAENYEEARSCFSEMTGRGKDILETARAMEKSAEEKYKQQTIRMF